jgi:PAS domain S-box-containing protein
MGYGYIGTAVAFSYTVYRHDLFAAVPVARRTAIEQLDEGLITLDLDGVVVSLNDAARRFLGESEELLGRPSVDVLGPFVEPFDLEASAEQSTTVETDAGVFDVTLTPVVRGESPIGNQLLLQNVTERHRREQQLTALNTRLSLALTETDTGVWELDLDTEELIFDEASERLYGYDPGAFPGTVEAFADRVSDTDFAAVEARIEHAIETGQEYRADFRVDHPDGGYRWIQARGVVQSDADGEPERILGIQTDVTERVVAAQSIEQQRDGLELLNSVVRHDIRNDLQLIDAYAQMLGETETEQNEQYLSVIRRATNNAVDLTTTARELAEVMLQTDPQPEPVDLRPVLEAEIDAVRQSYPESEIIIEGSIPDVMVSADELLDAVFRNLLKNAIQHNRQETPGIWVSVDCLAETVEIRIADNGPGVDDAHKETIFGKGNQGLDSDGTGIGLYLVQSLVDRYGGDVWVDDREPPSASNDQLQTAANESTGAVFVVQLAIHK